MKSFSERNLISHYRRRPLFGIGDFIVVLAVIFALTLAADALIDANTGDTAVVYVGGEEVMRLTLDVDTDYEIPGTHAVLSIRSGNAMISENDCPNGICISTGAVSRSGAAIVCAPRGIVVIIRGGSDSYVTG